VPQVLQIHGTLVGTHLVDVCYHSMSADIPSMSLHQKTTLQARLCWHDGGITLFLSFLEQTNWLAAYDTRACAMLGKFFVSDSTGLELVQELS